MSDRSFIIHCLHCIVSSFFSSRKNLVDGVSLSDECVDNVSMSSSHRRKSKKKQSHSDDSDVDYLIYDSENIPPKLFEDITSSVSSAINNLHLMTECSSSVE